MRWWIILKKTNMYVHDSLSNETNFYWNNCNITIIIVIGNRERDKTNKIINKTQGPNQGVPATDK